MDQHRFIISFWDKGSKVITLGVPGDFRNCFKMLDNNEGTRWKVLHLFFIVVPLDGRSHTYWWDVAGVVWYLGKDFSRTVHDNLVPNSCVDQNYLKQIA